MTATKTKIKWFIPTPKTLEELKKAYRTLAMKNHPDIKGGSVQAMQEINNEYDELFTVLKDRHETATGTTYTSTAKTTETPEQFRNIIDKLINLDGVTVEIVGSWIWLTGNTYTHKEVIKSIGFKWASHKKAWYFHNDDYKKKSSKHFDLDEIREMYGSQTVQTRPQIKFEVV